MTLAKNEAPVTIIMAEFMRVARPAASMPPKRQTKGPYVYKQRGTNCRKPPAPVRHTAAVVLGKAAHGRKAGSQVNRAGATLASARWCGRKLRSQGGRR